MQVRYKQVDVFSRRPLSGNPVAVFLEAAPLTPEVMQQIASWMNLSECTFVTPAADPRADYRVRIFDPRHEMPFAGHPTVGTAHALLEAGLLPRQPGLLVQECGVGLVRLHLEADGVVFFELPAPVFEPVPDGGHAAVAAALGLEAARLSPLQSISVGPRWLTTELDSVTTVLALTPDQHALTTVSRALGAEGVTVFAAYASGGAALDAAIEVRSFAPATGVPEDPVCGSGNGCVAALLRQRGLPLGLAYTASQGKALGRSGRVQIRYEGETILVGGAANTCLDGELRIAAL